MATNLAQLCLKIGEHDPALMILMILNDTYVHFDGEHDDKPLFVLVFRFSQLSHVFPNSLSEKATYTETM